MEDMGLYLMLSLQKEVRVDAVLMLIVTEKLLLVWPNHLGS